MADQSRASGSSSLCNKLVVLIAATEYGRGIYDTESGSVLAFVQYYYIILYHYAFKSGTALGGCSPRAWLCVQLPVTTGYWGSIICYTDEFNHGYH
jgi:hypothetical protein